MGKLGIVIPYRDRKEHLDVFLPYMREFLNKKGLSDYEFFVVEQDDSELFNRGLLLNCGFIKADAKGCDRVCFHDVDLLPVDSDLYSLYPEEPIELIQTIEGSVEPLPYNYFGGVTLVSSEDFRKVNGYSNWYEGWGFEDDDFLLRCHRAHIGRTVQRLATPNTVGSAIVFKEDRLVSEEVSLRKGMTLLVVDFVPEYPKANVGLQDMVVISLRDPLTNLETSISYDKFNCYRATIWDKNWHTFSIISGKAPLLHSRCVLAIDRAKKVYSFYWNGRCLGKQELRSSEICALRGKTGIVELGKNFRGSILEAGCYSVQSDLTDEELAQISLYGINFEYRDDTLSSWTLSGSNYPSSETTWIKSTDSIRVPVPLRANLGTFKTLGHKGNNITIDGHYLPEICKNQERFYAQARGEAPKEEDGLSTLYLWNKKVVPSHEDDVTWIKVKKRG